MKLRVLFLCTGNSCRSQIAEGLARKLKGDVIEPYSAGVSPKALDTAAVRVMDEVGIDISCHRSKHCDELKHLAFDYVVTVCDDAKEQCPLWLGKGKVLHRSFDDPPKLASEFSNEEEALNQYRRVRDEIRAFIERMPQILQEM